MELIQPQLSPQFKIGDRGGKKPPQVKTPVPQVKNPKSPALIPQQPVKAGALRPQQQVKIGQQARKPILRPQARTPILRPQQQVKIGQQARTPILRPQARTPILRPQARTPILRPQARTPIMRPQARTPQLQARTPQQPQARTPTKPGMNKGDVGLPIIHDPSYPKSYKIAPLPNKIRTKCNTCSLDFCKSEKPLSDRAREWLYDWIERLPALEYEEGKLLPSINKNIANELSNYKRCNPIAVYRGLSFEEKDSRNLQGYLPLWTGKEFLLEINRLTSWTTDYKISNEFARTGIAGFIMEMIANARDILADFNVMTKPFDSEKEVIILPGTYKVKVVYINNMHENKAR